MNRNLLIVGYGPQRQLAMEIAEEMHCFETIDFMEDDDVRGGRAERLACEYGFAVSAAEDSILRRRQTLRLREAGCRIPVLIHPRAFVGKYATLQQGCILEPMCAVQSGSALGEGVWVSAGCVVNHSAFVGEYCNLGPGSIIQPCSMLEAGATLAPGAICDGEVKLCL